MQPCAPRPRAPLFLEEYLFTIQRFPCIGVHEGARDKVFILSLGDGGQDSERRLAELQRLVSSAGGLVLGSVRQRPSRQNGPNLWGDGKLREAALEARRVGANLVVTDRELSPLQARHLERVLDLPVSDRS